VTDNESDTKDLPHHLVSSRDIKLHYLQARAQRVNTYQAHNELAVELAKRARAVEVFDEFIAMTGIEKSQKVLPTDFECLKGVIEAHDSVCDKFDDYSLQFVRHIVQACEAGRLPLGELANMMHTACSV
jgi:hypothetical protein